MKLARKTDMQVLTSMTTVITHTHLTLIFHWVAFNKALKTNLWLSSCFPQIMCIWKLLTLTWGNQMCTWANIAKSTAKGLKSRFKALRVWTQGFQKVPLSAPMTCSLSVCPYIPSLGGNSRTICSAHFHPSNVSSWVFFLFHAMWHALTSSGLEGVPGAAVISSLNLGFWFQGTVV